MKLGSLFDGSGGFPLAGAMNGIEPVWAAEIEPYPIAVTKSRFPSMKHYGDVSKMNGAEVAPVDIITFGSPCQDMSIAGKREGLKHEDLGDEETTRSGLFFEAIRIIKEMRKATNGEYPKYAVWENVPGAFSSNKGHDFHAVLQALCSVRDDLSVPFPRANDGTDRLIWNGAGVIVGNGYSIAWRTLDAQYWGVPRRRKRIYLVADFGSECAGEILFKPDGLRGNLPQGDAARKETAADAVGSVDGSSGNGGQLAATVIASYGTKWNGNAGAYNGENFVLQKHSVDRSVGAVGLDGYNFALTGEKSATIGVNCGMSTGRNGAIESFIAMATQQGGAEIAQNLCPTITAAAGMSGNNQPVIVLNDQGGSSINTAQGSCVYEDTQATLKAGGVHAVCYDARGNGDGETVSTLTGDHQNRITDYTAVAVQETFGVGNGQADQSHLHDVMGALNCMHDQQAVLVKSKPPRKYIIRRLTPTECARLQGFPDTWGHLAPYDPADADFWEEVRKTHAEINGKTYKPVKNLQKWYEGLHTDSAEYKMWGNGIALPCAEYVIGRIATVMNEKEASS